MNVQFCVLRAGSDEITHAMQIVELLEHYRPSVKVGQPKETGSGEREMNISKPKSIFMKQEHFKA